MTNLLRVRNHLSFCLQFTSRMIILITMNCLCDQNQFVLGVRPETHSGMSRVAYDNFEYVSGISNVHFILYYLVHSTHGYRWASL